MLLYGRGDNTETHVSGAAMQLNLCLTDWLSYLQRDGRGQLLAILVGGEGREKEKKSPYLPWSTSLAQIYFQMVMSHLLIAPIANRALKNIDCVIIHVR